MAQPPSSSQDIGQAPWYRWDPAAAGSHNLSRGNRTFTRPTEFQRTHGVRGAGPLPPEAAWSVSFDQVGSHATVGVATGDCKLMEEGYGYLFGQSQVADSWVLCFGKESGGSFSRAAGGVSQPWIQAGAQLPQPLKISLRLEGGRKLYATVPGAEEKLLIPALPTGVQLFAVASTVWGNSNLTISEKGEEGDEDVEMDQGKDTAAALPLGPPKGHVHGQGICRICTKCHTCTGSGSSCVKVHGRSRAADAGGLCGCGQGQAGCKQCGQCLPCCKAAAASPAAAAAVAANPYACITGGLCFGSLDYLTEALANAEAAGSSNTASSSGSALPSFPSAFENRDQDPRCLLELQLMKLVGAIRDKPRWQAKMQDQQVVDRWRAEAAAQGASQELLDFAFQQLQHDAALPGPGTEGAVPGVYTCDELVPEELRQALLQEVARLEALPPDWHPGSDQQVLDLVHPSLFCLVFNVTKQLPEGSVNRSNCLDLLGSGTPVQPPVLDQAYGLDNDWSTTTQWLPTNFDVDASGSVRIRSYMNNLHPRQYARLYDVVGRLFELALPLLERVLTRMASPLPHLIDPYAEPWYDDFVGGDGGDGDDDDYDVWWENREIKLPKLPAQFQAPPPPAVPVVLKGRRLQVIVKLANIQLTPQQPKYKGGSWHVEGMRNEHIVASAIYYYDQDNVTDSRLAFRVSVEEPNYEQNDSRGVQAVFGMEDGDTLNQELGAVTTLPGRCVCFPNTHQHQVQPFELQDKGRPGHRKILVFFLLDPSQAVLSTSEVPPQQLDWWQQEILRDPHTSLAQMPHEVMNVIGEALVDSTLRTPGGCPFSTQQARLYRVQLMEERKYFISEQNESHYEREFSLCEH